MKNLKVVGAVFVALALIAGALAANPVMLKPEGERLEILINRTLEAIERHQATWSHAGAGAAHAKSAQQNTEQDRRITAVEKKLDEINEKSSKILSILRKR